ncbi:translation initiation factor IF-2-like [Helianthus annuus]|uniref:translation initiation factor IF-2-like n=1 Tax=Helianthus annuus TaxID=4232 RepID=UPI000B8F9847|nr:translation initiation factor IF-2-like [Helianthus annuus]
MIEDKPKSRACAFFHDDEGFDWSQILPEEDRVDYQFKIRTLEDDQTLHKKHDHYAFVAEIKEENNEEKDTTETKEKTREEILNEKTYGERNIALNGMNEMQEEYESAVSNKRWDKKRECYFNREDDTYAKRHEKEIKYAMTSCLRKRDEERMKKSVEEMLINLKKTAEEVKAEAVQVEVEKKIEVVKEEDLKVVETEKIEEKVEVYEEVEKAVTEEQQIVEDEKKTESLTEVTIENLKSASDEKKEELKQTKAVENTKVPITEVLEETKDCENGKLSSLA